MSKFKCDVCNKKIHKLNKDWKFVNYNPKGTFLLNQDMRLIKRECNNCRDANNPNIQEVA